MIKVALMNNQMKLIKI